MVHGKQGKRLGGGKRSRGKLATGRGLEHKIMQFYAAKKMYATNMLKDAMEAVRLGKEWLETSQYKEALALLREEQGPAAAGQTGAEGDEGGLGAAGQRRSGR